MARSSSFPVRELDLRLHTNIVTERMNAVPGFRTSAAFFTFLRANLVLPPSTYNSTTSTPLLYATSPQTLPPLYTLGPSSLATMTSTSEPTTEILPSPSTDSNPLDSIPALTTEPLESEEDKIAALKLVADSIAQQRQAASRVVIFHPLVIATYVAVLGIIFQILYADYTDLPKIGTTIAGVTMAFLISVRSFTAGYLQLAEGFNWSFIKNEANKGEEDIVIASKFGEELIGVAILRLEPYGHQSSGSQTSNGRRKRKGGKALVRAWTTKLRYRGKGVGTELLETVVKTARDRMGKDVEIGFAVEHANSGKVLPEFLDKGLKKNEVKAAKKLDEVIENMDVKKRRGSR